MVAGGYIGVGCGVCTQESCSDTTGIMSRLLLVLGSTPLACSKTVAVVMVAMKVVMVFFSSALFCGCQISSGY